MTNQTITYQNNNMKNRELYTQAVKLLKELIAVPSFSGEEKETADLIAGWMNSFGIEALRFNNNVWAVNKYFDASRPSVLLNSHHDTVKPNKAYTKHPFEAVVDDGKLYGLGSNDAGGSLVSLLMTFLYFYAKKDLAYNLVFVASAEEEKSGKNGLRGMLEILPELDFAVVGEPTEMKMAVAERGLMVIDAYAFGKSGHAAHDNTDNPIYKAITDIERIKDFVFPKVSETLGAVKISVTQIDAGTQHNVVPSECHFVIDVRTNELYKNIEVFEIIDALTQSELLARSYHLNPSSISLEHPLVEVGKQLGLSTYGSPTLSDQAHLHCPSVKMGPGSSVRSHSANEYIFLNEIAEGIDTYINMFTKILIKKKHYETVG